MGHTEILTPTQNPKMKQNELLETVVEGTTLVGDFTARKH
jgi:hypothetical protein